MREATSPHHSTRRTLLRLAAATIGLGAARVTAAAQPLRIVYANPYIPYVWADGGATKGVLVDILNELVVKQFGIPLKHEAMAWKRGQDEVKEGSADGFGCSVTAERQQYANFGAEPLVRLRYGVFFLKANPRAAEIRRMHALDDFRAFTQGDFMGSGYAENNFKSLKIDWATSLEQVFRKVAAGHNDFLVASDMVGPWTLRKLELSDQFEVVPMTFLPASSLHLGLRKSYADGEALLQRLDAALKAAHADGTLRAIEARYT